MNVFALLLQILRDPATGSVIAIIAIVISIWIPPKTQKGGNPEPLPPLTPPPQKRIHNPRQGQHKHRSKR